MRRALIDIQISPCNLKILETGSNNISFYKPRSLNIEIYIGDKMILFYFILRFMPKVKNTSRHFAILVSVIS